MAAYEEQEFHQKLNLFAWKRMFQFVRPYRKNFMLVIGLILFSALIDIVLPLFQRYAVVKKVKRYSDLSFIKLL